MTEERIIDLEIKVAHHELAIEKLEELVAAQQTSIDQLEKLTKVLRERLEANLSGLDQVGPGNEKPPHY